MAGEMAEMGLKRSRAAVELIGLGEMAVSAAWRAGVAGERFAAGMAESTVRRAAKAAGASILWMLEIPDRRRWRPYITQRIRSQLPLAEAELAKETLDKAQVEGDPRLKLSAYCLLTRAVVHADSPIVPEEVAGSVVDIADELGLHPLETPLNHATAQKAQDFLDRVHQDNHLPPSAL